MISHPPSRPLRILVVGSMPPPLGGGTISLKTFVGYLEANDHVEVRVVNSSNIRGNVLLHPLHLIRFFLNLVLSVFLVDVVSNHGATTALPSAGLLTMVLSRIARKPLIIRKYADLDYMDLGALRGRIAHYVASHADVYLTETKRLNTLSKSRGLAHTSWYPTSRPEPEPAPTEQASSGRKQCRRFVYMGQVREYKGIRELIEAAERCNKNISVDIYGPVFNDLEPQIFNNLERVTMHGPIPSSEVIPTLRQYDMNLLPTKAPTEGYPGIVFEGYSVGLPIIASACGAIPEIVDETSGILIEPGNVDELFEAINRVVDDDQLYAILRSGARNRFKGFSSKYWADQFVDMCKKLTRS